MFCAGKNQDDSVVRVQTKNGWAALAVSGFEQITDEPEQLCLDFEKTFKAEGQNCVGLKRLNCNGEEIFVVVKRHINSGGVREFFRSLWVSKAFRNFRRAVELQEKNIAVVRPLAALQRRKLGRLQENIFVTEYKNGRISLNDFVHGRMGICDDELPGAKREIAIEVGRLLADLHKASMWHRDTKVANFLVYKNDENKFKAELVDMDGIKPYRFRREQCQLRTLWKLAESLSRFSMAQEGDYLRGFGAYCDFVGIDKERRKKMFARSGRMAMAMRLSKLAEEACKNK